MEVKHYEGNGRLSVATECNGIIHMTGRTCMPGYYPDIPSERMTAGAVFFCVSRSTASVPPATIMASCLYCVSSAKASSCVEGLRNNMSIRFPLLFYLSGE